MPRKILVIGGGAAGIIAAWRAAELGAQVTLLEKNARLGMKILISGGGKCNLTHDGSMEAIRAAFRSNEALFLKPSFYKFANTDFLALLHTRGMQTYVRPDGRIFPVEPTNAKDVVSLLTQRVQESGVEIRCSSAVDGLVTEGGNITGVRFNGIVSPASHVIIAVGGSSYPATGATGDGWKWASEAGHAIIPLRAALAPLCLQTARPDWSGVALRDIVLRARPVAGAKEFARWRGDLLFTHKGLSGPAALGISRDIAEQVNRPHCVVEVDLAPQESYEEVVASILDKIKGSPRSPASSLIAPYVPGRLVDAVAESAGIDTGLRGAHIAGKALKRLASTLKGWPLGAVRDVPLERGEVVAGGVALGEVDPQTMQSRIVQGLYLCGEILDIAGPVGGYNLQAAWSTGWTAGNAAAHG